MSFVNYEDDWKYADTRLRDTVLLAKNIGAVYIHYINELCIAKVSLICDLDTALEVPLSEIITVTPEMGFVNLTDKGICTYSSRKPTRFYKQGLKQSNISCGKFYFSVHSPYFGNTLNCNYPDLLDCANSILTEEVREKAFSRQFALVKSKDGDFFNLLYRGFIVGDVFINVGDTPYNIKLYDNFYFLKETLEESFNV